MIGLKMLLSAVSNSLASSTFIREEEANMSADV